MATPQVSVIIPTYNRAALVSETIDSVLAQQYADCEIIVVNDGSADQTDEVLAGYGDQIRVIRQANAGVAAATNRGVAEAKADLIAFVDDDDRMLPGRLAAQVELMRAHDELGAVTGNLVIEGRESEDYLASCGVEFDGRDSVVSPRPLAQMLLRNFMANSASMVRAACVEDVGPYDTTLPSSQDTEFWLRVARRWPLGCVKLPCTWVRCHGESLTVSPHALKHKIRVIARSLGWNDPQAAGVRKRVARRLYWLLLDYLKAAGEVDSPEEIRSIVDACSAPLPWLLRRRVRRVAGRLA